MAGPLVSIVIPSYNTEPWIGDAIQSALDQTWPNKEIIVIDDGSTDASIDRIKSFGGRIRTEFGPNRGGSAARNRGLALAVGDWIQFLDGDDLLMPDCIRAKMNQARDAKIVVCSDVEIMTHAAMTDAGGPAFWFESAYDLEYILRFGPPQTSAPLHLREHLLAIGGFREDLPCAQDFDLHLRLAIQLSLRFISNGKTGVKIRPRAGSVSRSAGARMHQAIAEVLLHGANLLRTKGELSAPFAEIISQRATLLARKLWHLGQTREATAIALGAKQVSPRWYESAYRGQAATRAARCLGFERFERLRDWGRHLRGAKAKS